MWLWPWVWSTALLCSYEFAFETSSFTCYFQTSLNPFVWNFFILLQTLLWETEQENTLLKIKMTVNSENIKPVVQCPCTWPHTGAAVMCSLWQNRAQGIASAASPWTTIVPGLQGLLPGREAILTGWVLTRTSTCSAVSHCLLAIASKQLSVDLTMPVAVLLLYYPVQLRVVCYYVYFVKYDYFYLQGPSTPQITFIFMQKEILASCR